MAWQGAGRKKWKKFWRDRSSFSAWGGGRWGADGMELFCMMLVESAGRPGEMAMQGREKIGVKAYEARRSSATSSRTATRAGVGGRVITGDKNERMLLLP